MRKLSALFVILVGIACASMAPTGGTTGLSSIAGNDQAVRIALVGGLTSGRVGASGSWRGYENDGARLIARAGADEAWSVTSSGSRVRVTRGSSAENRTSPIVIRPTEDRSFVTWNGKRYRGELVISATDSGLMVVNRLALESYLRGVVPLEIGNRKPEEHAAVEAQAVAARSYSYLHLAPTRLYDMMGTVQDQVYGGIDAEKPVSDEAVAATEGLVLLFAGKVINTPYHSTCGGSTAAVHEVWYSQPDEPYLKQVSDRIPGSDAFYCDPSPRFSWTSSFDRSSLRTVLEKYLANYTNAPRGGIGRVTGIYEQGRTESNRVAALRIDTDRGSYTLRGNDIRFVLRTPNGEILNSTYFTAEATVSGGEVSALTLRGRGFGHGIGMCQWGAIGRARAGQDYRMILSTYYPGTTIGRAR